MLDEAGRRVKKCSNPVPRREHPVVEVPFKNATLEGKNLRQ